MKLITWLKNKWGITSNKQFIIINVVFAITGSTVVFVKKYLFELLSINELPFLLKIPLYLVIVPPSYFLILSVYSIIFGQTDFFNPFIKRALKRFIPNSIGNTLKSSK
jgi:hypothetical protein